MSRGPEGLQRVIIPRGLVNPNATAIIEIPANYRTSPTVIAKPRDDPNFSSSPSIPRRRRRVVRKTTTTEIVNPTPPRTIPRRRDLRQIGLQNRAASYGGHPQSYEPGGSGFPWERSLAGTHFYGDHTLENDFAGPIPCSTPRTPINGLSDRFTRTFSINGNQTYPSNRTHSINVNQTLPINRTRSTNPNQTQPLRKSTKKTVVTSTSYDADVSNDPSSNSIATEVSEVSEVYDITDDERDLTDSRPAIDLAWTEPEAYDYVPHHPDQTMPRPEVDNSGTPDWFRPQLESSRCDQTMPPPEVDSSGTPDWFRPQLESSRRNQTMPLPEVNRSGPPDRYPPVWFRPQLESSRIRPYEQRSSGIGHCAGGINCCNCAAAGAFRSLYRSNLELTPAQDDYYTTIDIDQVPFLPLESSAELSRLGSLPTTEPESGSFHPYSTFDTPVWDYPRGWRSGEDDHSSFMTESQFQRMLQEGSYGNGNESFARPGPSGIQGRANETNSGPRPSSPCGGRLNETHSGPGPCAANTTRTNQASLGHGLDATFNASKSCDSGRGGLDGTFEVPPSPTSSGSPHTNLATSHASYFPRPTQHLENRNATYGEYPAQQAPTYGSWIHSFAEYPPDSPIPSRALSSSFESPSVPQRRRFNVTPCNTSHYHETPRSTRCETSFGGCATGSARVPGASRERSNAVFTVSPVASHSNNSPRDLVSHLEQTEASEREQLGADLRNWQKCRRKLIFDASNISTSSMSGHS